MMITSPLDGNKQNKIFLYGNVLNNGIEKKMDQSYLITSATRNFSHLKTSIRKN